MFSTESLDDNTQVTSLKQNQSFSSDVPETTDNTQTFKHNSRDISFNMLLRELIFCTALGVLTYGALHTSPSKVSKHPPAVRFFSKGSPVTDWYGGQLSHALAAIHRADVSLVMYYAPWDAECQHVRLEFEKAATVLGDYVYFAAINCWNPGSECRQQHNKISNWPVIMAYTVNSKGVLYKGSRDAQSLVKFLELIMLPVKRISSVEDLVNLLSVCDVVAVGYTPLKESPKYYNMWYSVALKSREYDTFGEICFASVITEELASDLGVEVLPNVRLMLWNETKEFQGDLNTWNEATLMHWLLENFSQPVARIMPMWQKAFSFHRYVNGNPLLILFTPLNPLYHQLPVYDSLREVAMEYYNCNNNQWAEELMKLQQVQRLLYQKKNVMKYCKDYNFKKKIVKPNNYNKKEVLSQYNKYPWHNTTQKSQRDGLFGFLLKRGLAISSALESSFEESDVLSPTLILGQYDSKSFPAEKMYYDHNEKCHSFEESFVLKENIPETLDISMLPKDDDPLSAEGLIHENMYHFCKLMRFAEEWGPPLFATMDDSKDQDISIRGLACEKNFTISMIAIDSVRDHHFAESLGIDISNRDNMTAVVILDSKFESQYIMDKKYSPTSIREFIVNYTNNSLKRFLRSQVKDVVYNHYYRTNETTDRRDGRNITKVMDLTTQTFNRFVKTSGSVGIIAVCGGAGGCSASVTRSLLAATNLLQECGVSTQAARIDASRHDLQWQYTVQFYPMIVVFPANRAGDSLTYPTKEHITASGLLALALRTLGPQHNMRVRLALCARAQGNDEKKSCMKDLRYHLMGLIGRNLKYWRTVREKSIRDALLTRLMYLRQTYLDLHLLHTSDVYVNSEKQVNLLESLNKLAQHWELDLSVLSVNNTKTHSNSL